MSTIPTPFTLHVGHDVLADRKTGLPRGRGLDGVPRQSLEVRRRPAVFESLVEYWRSRLRLAHACNGSAAAAGRARIYTDVGRAQPRSTWDRAGALNERANDFNLAHCR